MLAYYPDQLDAYFAFDVSDAILAAVRSGLAGELLPVVVRLQREAPVGGWSPFLRNHDQTRTMTTLGEDLNGAKLAATILLSLPGLPFVYYGEEIGMTGDKPDPRIRTPMQWSTEPGAGFTDGLAWEPLQPDSLTANVAVEDSDSTSLLHLYRSLIHLRSTNPALGGGTLVPLRASRDHVLSYLRRQGNDAVLIVVNLGTTQLSGVTVESDDAALATGTYELRGLLDNTAGTELQVGPAGRIERYPPMETLAPRIAHVFALTLVSR